MSGLMYGSNAGGSNAGGSNSEKEKPELGMDVQAENSFLGFFKNMEQAQPGTVRLFDRGDFYSAHGQDALLVASTVFKTHSVLKYLGSGKNTLPSCTLSQAAAKNFLRESLTSKQMRIEIWGGGGKRSQNWSLVKQASPGNLQAVEDLLFSNTDIVSSPIVLALNLKMKEGTLMVGAAYADATNRDLGVAEFADNTLFSNTESLLIQLGVKECVLPADDKSADYDLSKLRLVVDRCDCVVTERKKSEFSTKDIEQDINRLLSGVDENKTIPELDLKVALGSLSALVSYLSLLADSDNFNQFKIHTHDLSQYLRLDNSALRALNLFPEPNATGQSKSTSVYGLLNHCKTAQGMRLLSQWLKQPLVNLHQITQRQNLCEIFVEDVSARQMLQTELKFMPDLHRISKRFQKGGAGLEDVIRVYQAIERLSTLIENLEAAETPSSRHSQQLKSAFTEQIKDFEANLSNYVGMVEATIDLDELKSHNYVVKADYSEKLTRIRDKMNSLRDSLDEEHQKAGRDLGLDIEKKLHLENNATHGYCLRLTRADASAIKNKKKYHEIATVKGGVFFATNELKEYAEEYVNQKDRYSRESGSVVKEIVTIASSYCMPLEELNVVLAQLDVIISFAESSACASIPYTKPIVLEKGGDESAELKIEEGRHPCLELQEDVSFIPNDTVMKPGESEFLVITGPNMGGKSTYIRQVGIIALMAQIGCFVPANEGATLPVFDCILARVGAGDSMLKGVSTFMAEMLETATILKTATKDSLIIIDELGRGTSTYDGFGLAWAISEWICTKIHCKTLFATHFHELTSLSKQQPHVKNLHVVTHVTQREGGSSKLDRDVTLLYKVEEGFSDQSYGINVAEMANFPDSVIKVAKRKAEELEDFESDEQNPLAMDKESTDEGVAVIQNFLKTFAERTSSISRSDDMEVYGVDGESTAKGNKKRRTEIAREQIEELKKVVEEFKPRLENSAFVRKVLESC